MDSSQPIPDASYDIPYRFWCAPRYGMKSPRCNTDRHVSGQWAYTGKMPPRARRLPAAAKSGAPAIAASPPIPALDHPPATSAPSAPAPAPVPVPPPQSGPTRSNEGVQMTAQPASKVGFLKRRPTTMTTNPPEPIPAPAGPSTVTAIEVCFPSFPLRC
jgi:hypothetical protein